MHAHVCMCVYVCMHMCMCVCACMCTCACVCMYHWRLRWANPARHICSDSSWSLLVASHSWRQGKKDPLEFKSLSLFSQLQGFLRLAWGGRKFWLLGPAWRRGLVVPVVAHSGNKKGGRGERVEGVIFLNISIFWSEAHSSPWHWTKFSERSQSSLLIYSHVSHFRYCVQAREVTVGFKQSDLQQELFL